MWDSDAVATLATVGMLMIVLLAAFMGLVEWLQSGPRADRAATRAHQINVLAVKRPLPQYPMLTHLTEGAKTYSPHVILRNADPAQLAAASPLPALPAPADLPGYTTLSQVLAMGWRPRTDAILTGLGPGGAQLTGPASKLVHLLFAGATDGGKSHLFRLIMAQLLAVGYQVILLDEHYTPVNPDTGDDWRAIGGRLQGGAPVTHAKDIVSVLHDLATRELDARKERWHAMEDPGPPLYVFADEWPGLVDADKRVGDWMRVLVRQGRKFRMYLGLGSQDAQVRTLGESSGVRTNFRTNYYVGGDPYTKEAILRLPRNAPEPPGQGVVYLRWPGAEGAQLVRVPLADNAGVATLLRPAPASNVVDLTSYRTLPAAPWDLDPDRAAPATGATGQTGATADVWAEIPPKARAAIQSLQSGQSLPAAIEAAYEVSKRNPNAFNPAYQEVQAAMRLIMQRAGLAGMED